ncbi:hypothetical protein [Luteococcus sp. OSA5]|uniref:hypothetical protein n=1 Tax=Luteococcus sp. OSA5 TaxID=3401630 RepID=UPI003B42F327
MARAAGSAQRVGYGEQVKDRPDVQFCRALSDAIARQSLTLEQISQQMTEAGRRISIATLSYWQRGRSLPSRESSLAVIGELERVLRLPVGHLQGALPSDAFSRWDRVHALPEADRARGVLEELGLDPMAHFDTMSVHDHVHVAADGLGRVEETRELLVSRTEQLGATALVLGIGADDDVPEIEAIMGCTLGRVVVLPDLGLMAVELHLPAPAAMGEPVLRGTRVRWRADDARTGEVARVLGRSLPIVVLEASFERAPQHAWYETTPNQWQPSTPTHPMRQQLTAAQHLQVCLTDPPAGWHSLSWEYDDHA